jgi:hypothetical protein
MWNNRWKFKKYNVFSLLAESQRESLDAEKLGAGIVMTVGFPLILRQKSSLQ